MLRKTEKLTIGKKGTYLYKPDNTPYWQLRIKIGEHKLQESTRCKNEDEAKMYAIEAYINFKNKIERGDLLPKILISDIASELIEELRNKTSGSDKSIKNYISIIDKMKDGFFKGKSITDIRKETFEEYAKWRKSTFGTLKKSTVNKHNIAVKMIFEKIQDKGIAVNFRSSFLVNDGEDGVKRKSITIDDYEKISRYIDYKLCEFDDNRHRRGNVYSLVHEIMDFILCTGARPGVELTSIQWKDINVSISSGIPKIVIKIKKAKTKERNSIVSYRFISILNSIANRRKDRAADDYLFSLDGKTKISSEYLSRVFSEILKETGIKDEEDRSYSFYSLRHSYMSWRAFTEINNMAIAKQCGTSVAMIEKFYAHFDIDEQHRLFGGIKDESIQRKNYLTEEKSMTELDKNRIEKTYSKLAKNCLERGFP